MLAPTANFNAVKIRKDARYTFLLTLELKNATETLYLSDHDIAFASGEVFEPAVASWGTLSQSLDLFNRRASASNIEITLVNTPYLKSGTAFRHLSERIPGHDYVYQKASIYLWIEGITQFSDCLKLFEGRIQPLSRVTPETLSLTLIDPTFLYDKQIPQHITDLATFPDLPIDLRVIKYKAATSILVKRILISGGYSGQNLACPGIELGDSLIHVFELITAASINTMQNVTSLFYISANGYIKSTYHDTTGNLLDVCFYDANGAIPQELKTAIPDVANKLDVENLPIPLVYGDFTLDADLQGVLTEGRWISPTKIVFADHVLKQIDALWVLDPNLDRLVKIDAGDITITLDDNGRSTVTINNLLTTDGTVYISPTYCAVTNDVQEPDYPMVNMDGRVFDKLSSTYGEMRCSAHAPGGSYDVDGLVKFYFPKIEQPPVVAGGSPTRYIQCRYTLQNANYLDEYAKLRFWQADPGTWAYGTLWLDTITGSYGEAGVGISIGDLGTDGNYLQMEVHYTTPPTGNGLQITYLIREVRMKFTYRLAIETGWRVFAECKGRKFGTWIDDTGRTNDYNAGDVIDHPAFIIESILRDELGLTNAEIDAASFDEAWAENTAWLMAISLKDQNLALGVIEKITKEARFAFVWASLGLARLAILRGSPVEADTLGLEDIVRGSFAYDAGDLTRLVNSVAVNYYLDPAGDSTRKRLLGSNSASQSKYNLVSKYDIDSKFIQTDAVAGYLKDFFVGTSGLWKNLLETIAVEMLDLSKIHWEIGDVIFPDSTFSSLIRPLNGYWGIGGSPIFMIVEKSVSSKSLKYKMALVGAKPIG